MFSAADQKRFIKGDHLKFNDGSSKLLSGHKFQDKYVVLQAEKLLLYRDIKVSTFLFSAKSAGLLHADKGWGEQRGSSSARGFKRLWSCWRKTKCVVPTLA